MELRVSTGTDYVSMHCIFGSGTKYNRKWRKTFFAWLSRGSRGNLQSESLLFLEQVAVPYISAC